MRKVFTHFDTGCHGYVSVPKSLIKELGINPEDISKYSGMNYTRVFLEEDSDASLVLSKMEERGIDFELKSSYRPYFSVHHNYNAELFDYVLEDGDILDETYQVVNAERGYIINMETGRKYRIPKSNPFKYFEKAEKISIPL